MLAPVSNGLPVVVVISPNSTTEGLKREFVIGGISLL
jgi:hypothetical protein